MSAVWVLTGLAVILTIMFWIPVVKYARRPDRDFGVVLIGAASLIVTLLVWLIFFFALVIVLTL